MSELNTEQLWVSYNNFLEVYEKAESPSLETARNIDCVLCEAGHLRYLAAFEIILKMDVESFRARVDRAVRLMLLLIEGHSRGIDVGDSCVAMNQFHWALDALVIGDLPLAREFCSKIGGRVKLERRFDSKFSRAIGYGIKELVTTGKCSNEVLNEIKAQLGTPSLIGYAMLVEGISNRDTDLAERGVKEALKGHRILTRPGGMFSLTPDEYLCFWIVGLLNFAAYQGLKINVPDSELLPKSLLKLKL